MSDRTISPATRILRPEVDDACYALDNGVFYRCETLRSGQTRATRLRRAPRGQTCWGSDDGFRTTYPFTVGPEHGRAMGLLQAVYLVCAAAALPAAMILLSGSTRGVAVLIGLAAAVLCLVGAYTEHLADRDPTAAVRLGAVIAADVAAHAVLDRRRAAHSTWSPR